MVLRTVSALVAAVLAASPATGPGGGPAAAATGRQAGTATVKQSYTSVTPTRLLDTRTGLGTAGAGAVGPGGTVDVQVTGRAGIPASGVAAVVLNVTVVAPDRSTYLTVYPAGGPRPTASTLNADPGAVRANLVFAGVGAGGQVTIYNYAGHAHVLADVTGWYADGSIYTPRSPSRVLDTRIGLGAPAGRVGAGAGVDVPVLGVGGVPASGVSAVAVNLTGIRPTRATYVTVYPTGKGVPTASNLNLPAGGTAAVLAVVGVGAGGRISLFNNAGAIDLAGDVEGWFDASGGYVPITPTRLVDSRPFSGLQPGATTTLSLSGFAGIPATATSAVLSVTAVNPTTPTYLTVYPSGTARPGTSNLNAPAGSIVPNLVLVDVGSGAFNVYNRAGHTDLVVDVLGWTAGPPTTAGATTTVAGTAGTALSASLNASGGVLPLTWSLAGGTLPAGITLSTAGLLSGTPTAAGTTTAVARVTDGAGQSADLQVAVTIAIAAGPGVFPTGEVGHPYTSPAPVLVGGTAPYTWSVLSGTVPSGLTLDPATGVLSGAPDSRGQGELQLRVVDANGATGTRTAWLTVYPHEPHGVFGWGTVNAAQLGNGLINGRGAPVQPIGLNGIGAVAGGALSGYALRSDGTVWAWGNGLSGQLGNGRGVTSGVPVQVAGLSGVVSIAAAAQTAYAVRSDGTVWAWGSGAGGLLGTGGSAPNALTPVQVPGISTAVAVSAGPADAYVVGSDGSVWAWGAANSGALGDGRTAPAFSAPVRVTGLTGITAVSAGVYHAIARASDGTVWAWGAGGSGQLGNGTTTPAAATPVRVSGLTGITAIASAGADDYALNSDGTVWSWGAAALGRLGTGAGADATVPARIPGLSGVISIAAGRGNGYAVTQDGTVQAWGPNDAGQLGNASPVTTVAATPVTATLVPSATSIGSGPAAPTVFIVGTP